jgi:uncharacterized repeat protein (TIGR03803 family)
MNRKHFNYLLALFYFISSHIYAQPQLLGNCGRGGSQFGTIFKYNGGDTSLASVYNFPGNSGSGIRGLTKVGNFYYGCTFSSGTYGTGNIFRYDLISNTYNVLYNFIYSEGSQPSGKLLLASNGKLYGTTVVGGPSHSGVIFEFDIQTNTYTNKFSFTQSINGSQPQSNLIQASNGKVYGTAATGGAFGDGTLFEYDIVTNTFTHKFDFNEPNGKIPIGGLFETPTGSLIGTTMNGGANNYGVIYEYDLILDTCYKRLDFNGTNGKNPVSAFVYANGSKVLGVTSLGGNNDCGVLFEYDYGTFTCIKKIDFSSPNGKMPRNSLLKAQNGKYYGLTYQGGIYNAGVVYEYDYTTNIFQKKFDFSETNGINPDCALIKGNFGKLYGATTQGGQSLSGTIFEYNINSNIFKKLIDLNALNGSDCRGKLLLASNGKYYGMTYSGGLYDSGVLFEYDYNSNVHTKKFDFQNSTGHGFSSLIQASNGNLYGMTYSGGVNDDGVIFEYDIITNIYTKKFDFAFLNGTNPRGSLIEASDGKLYGMTSLGGSANYGILFQYDYVNNIFSKKIDLTDSTGTLPEGALFEASDGKLYGMTTFGGTYDEGAIFQYDVSNGTLIKKIDLNSTIGAFPKGEFIETSPGYLFGLTYGGGANSCGTIIQYDIANNIITNKFDFVDALHGKNPTGTLCHASNNKLYGMTSKGAANSRGTIFEYDLLSDTCIKKIDLEMAITGWSPGHSFVEVGCIAPGITASGPLSFCQGDSVTLTAGGIAGTTYQWNRNGNIIAGATSQSLVVTKKGNYSVSVSDPLCPSLLTSHPVKVKIPCIPPFEPQERYQFDDVYINYNHGTQFVEIHANNLTATSTKIFITDQTGRVLANEIENIDNATLSKQINCTQFATGIYIVKIITDKEQFTHKFVKEY